MSATMVDSYRAPSYTLPHRKPVPTPSTGGLQIQDQQASAHSRSRTSSSSVFPQVNPSSTFTSYGGYGQQNTVPQQQQPQQVQPNMYQQSNYGTRRTLSNATTSTTSSAGRTSGLRRNSSTRSTQPTSYVALMRKQKATVWCDRAQHEDPRILAQQRAAKMRATQEVVGGTNHGRMPPSSSGGSTGMRSKIAHRAPKAQTYAPANLAGSGVPMRLSATEVDEGDSDNDSNNVTGQYHHRSGSGRSSLGSGRRVSSYNAAPQGRYSTNSTPPSGNGSPENLSELAEETPVPSQCGRQSEYFGSAARGTGLSGGSGSSGERENSFGNLGTMPEHTRNETKQSVDELRRRGSVDERTMTMSGAGAVRLFVANPDADDSD